MAKEKPNIALLDLVLPVTDGIKLMNEVRETADVPVVFPSMYGQEEIEYFAKTIVATAWICADRRRNLRVRT